MATKTFKVHLTRFTDHDKPAKIREVIVPSNKLNNTVSDLDQIYHFGQNVICNSPECYSVSMGDIIEFNEEFYLVNDFGFIKKGDTDKPISNYLAIDLEYKATHPMLKEHFGYLQPKK